MALLLPFDSVKEFLTDSPLVKLTRVDVKSVYDAMIEIVTVWHTRTKSSPTIRTPVPPQCSHCKIGYFVIDETEALKVCSNCGVVAESGLIIEHNCQTYKERHDDLARHARAVPKDVPKDVPKWLQQSLDAQDDDHHRFVVDDALEHWNSNPFAADQRLTKDQLASAKMDAMIPVRCNTTVRAVAAMLSPKVYEFFDMNDIRDRISKGKSLPIMAYSSPVPRYACFKCGAAVHEPYMQRRHPCGWGGKRKR